MNQDFQAFCFSKGIVKQKNWQRLLGVSSAYSVSLWRNISVNDDTLLVDWGNKRKFKSEQLAKAKNLPLIRLEDGFVRSVGLPDKNIESYSLVVDDLGIYYDSRTASRLEKLINGETLTALPRFDGGYLSSLSGDSDSAMVADLENVDLLSRAHDCIERITADHLSKFNHLDDIKLGPQKKYRVLLIDQVASDLSIEGGGANSATFRQMLHDAQRDHPDAEIYIKTHPVVQAGGRESYFRPNNIGSGVSLITANCNALSLIKQVDEVYVVTSQVGFEALMLNKKVTCYGQPFYAGWGLTRDIQSMARRVKKRSLAQVFAATYFLYSYYFHPVTGDLCHLEDVLDFVSRQRRAFHRNRGLSLCYGFPPWKRAYVKRFLYSPWGDLKFFQNERSLLGYLDKTVARVVQWGNTAKTIGVQLRHADIELLRVEDGFIRSVGLGKYYIPPLSLVFDREGMYYDPRSASELETILSTAKFGASELASAEAIIAQLAVAKVTKYNVGNTELPEELLAVVSSVRQSSVGQGSGDEYKDAMIILVPGQVENDVSIQLACGDINTDVALLEEVRRRRPKAIILYKPHPDVVSGNAVNYSLSTSQHSDKIKRLADYVLTEVDMDSCLKIADEVHTMTSLSGFEALIRGIRVFSYGSPFYSGWGLTEDERPVSRRQRVLGLTELVAGVLIHYPRYIDYRTGFFISAEDALKNIIASKIKGDSDKGRVKTLFFVRWYKKTKNLVASLLYGLRFC